MSYHYKCTKCNAKKRVLSYHSFKQVVKDGYCCVDCMKIKSTEPKKSVFKKRAAFKKYKKRVKELTEQQDLSSIKNIEIRSFENQLDHIVPIYQGYKHNVPPEIIADVKNLRIIPKKENSLKAFRLTEEVIKHIHILEIENYFQDVLDTLPNPKEQLVEDH